MFNRFCVSIAFAVLIECGSLLNAEAVNNHNGYKTYTMSDPTKHATLPDGSVTIDGTGYSTTSVQGMNVGTSYIYTAKIYSGSEKYPNAVRRKAAEKTKSVLKIPLNKRIRERFQKNRSRNIPNQKKLTFYRKNVINIQ